MRQGAENLHDDDDLRDDAVEHSVSQDGWVRRCLYNDGSTSTLWLKYDKKEGKKMLHEDETIILQ